MQNKVDILIRFTFMGTFWLLKIAGIILGIYWFGLKFLIPLGIFWFGQSFYSVMTSLVKEKLQTYQESKEIN